MRTYFPLAFLLTVILAVPTAQGATRTWTGAGGDNRFSTVTNWVEMVAPAPGDDLVFPATAAQYSLIDDMFLDQILNSVTFEGGNYTIGGFGKTRGVTVNAGNQILGSSIWTIIGLVTIESGASLSATVFGRDSVFTIDGPGHSTFAIQSSFGGVVTKRGTGTASITALPSGGIYSITVNGGRLILSGSSSTGNGPFTVTNGVLEAGYASTSKLTVTGSNSTFIGTGFASTLQIVNGGKFAPASCYSGIQSYNIDLTGGILDLSLSGCDGNPNHYLIQSPSGASPNPVAGNFSNYPDGTIFTLGGRLLRIIYHGGDGNDVQILPAPAVTSDFDGDRDTDVSVFRASDSTWYVQDPTGFAATQWGLPGDKIVPADYDGDGKADVAVYRPSDGTWYVLNSGNGTVLYKVFGLAEDLPTPADYDGDGTADISVFRPSTGTWYRVNSLSGTFSARQFGTSGDKPTPGDFDGDGKADIALFRPSSGVWYRINSSTGSIFGEQFGLGSDLIVPADYDGDGRTDLAVYRPSNGYWYIKNSADTTYAEYHFGLADDIPATGDFDGDNKADLSVFRPSDGIWYRQNSSNGSFFAFPFGVNGDKPTMTSFRY